MALALMMLLLAAIGGLAATSLRSGRYVERHLADIEITRQIVAGLPARGELAKRKPLRRHGGLSLAARHGALSARFFRAQVRHAVDAANHRLARRKPEWRGDERRHSSSRQDSRAMRARGLSAKPKPGSAGFTLFEALVSVALMSLIVASLSAVTGQWVPNWHRGFGNVQRLESFDLGLRRVVADLASAEFVTANGASKTPLFIGDALSVMLVRRAFGPDTTPHLELVNFAETADERGFALVRTRAPFAPLAANVPIATQLHLADPVPLIRAPFRVSFSYAGPDRLWRDTWTDQPRLPSAVRVLVRDAATGKTCRSQRRRFCTSISPLSA